jgi:NAD+ kinase
MISVPTLPLYPIVFCLVKVFFSQRRILKMTIQKKTKITFFVSKNADAQKAFQTICESYEQSPLKEADVIVVLGGDGFLLRVLHQVLPLKKPVFGMNCGSLGFLMNPYNPDHLLERLSAAKRVALPTLEMNATDTAGETFTFHAINEVSLFRKTALTGHVKISVDDQCHLEELVCDGVLLSTPAGSTAYNLSAHGPIIPLDSNILALTPISAFRPRRWQGALLSDKSKVIFDVLTPEERPLAAVADFHEIPNVKSVAISVCPTHTLTLLFDPERALENRILKEQFLT